MEDAQNHLAEPGGGNATQDTHQGVLPFPRRREFIDSDTFRAVAVRDFAPAVNQLLLGARTWATHFHRRDISEGHVIIHWTSGQTDTTALTSRGLRDPQAVSRALLQNIAASETMDAVTTPVPVAAPALQALLLRALARARRQQRPTCELDDLGEALQHDLSSGALVGPVADALLAHWPEAQHTDRTAQRVGALLGDIARDLPLGIANSIRAELVPLGAALSDQRQAMSAQQREHESQRALLERITAELAVLSANAQEAERHPSLPQRLLARIFRVSGVARQKL